jgi:hypothetical protein
VTRTPRLRVLPIALLVCLASGCNYKKKSYFAPTAAPSAAYVLTVTLDSCGCARCRLFVQNPASRLELFDRTDPPPNVEMSVSTCYVDFDPNVPLGLVCPSGLLDPKVTVGIECGGGCLGPPPCAASATVKADGTDLPMPGQMSAPTAACTTLDTTDASCQDLETVCIPPSAPLINCS